MLLLLIASISTTCYTVKKGKIVITITAATITGFIKVRLNGCNILGQHHPTFWAKHAVFA